MKRDLIIQRLQDTVQMMKNLKDSQFDFRGYVSRFDPHTCCGTICCVLGWYPKYFPESNLIWHQPIFGHVNLPWTLSSKRGNETHDIYVDIYRWHGFSNALIDAMFYPETMMGYDADLQFIFGYSTSSIRSRLQIILHLERAIELIAQKKLDEYLNLSGDE